MKSGFIRGATDRKRAASKKLTYKANRQRKRRLYPAGVFGVPLRVPNNSKRERAAAVKAVANYAASLKESKDAQAAFRRARNAERVNAITAKRKKAEASDV